MKSYVVSFGIIVIFLGSVSVASAISQKKSFGGRITNTTANEIEETENANYKCAVPGTSISIRTVGMQKKGTMSFVIPTNVRSKTNTRTKNNQWILGLQSQGKTSVTCIFQGTPPNEKTVNLDTIDMYGTSKN